MINIITVKEQNEFYNSSKINNGGGYAQPIVLFEVNGTPGFYQDLSCGDFGKRFTVKFDNRIYECDEVGKFSLADYEYYSEFGDEYLEFIDEFESVFGVRILTISEAQQ
jgi:hypothetical protein